MGIIKYLLVRCNEGGFIAVAMSFLLAIMSFLTYYYHVSPRDKPLIWLHEEVQTPPLSNEARIEAGFLLRLLQKGERLSMPHSRPMPTIGRGCNELRVNDKNSTWRIVYRVDFDAIVIVEVFDKKSEQTPHRVIDLCRKRLKEYDEL